MKARERNGQHQEVMRNRKKRKKPNPSGPKSKIDKTHVADSRERDR